MSDRLTPFLQPNSYTDKYQLNFKKSPYKQTTYEATVPTREVPNKSSQPYSPNFKEFDNIKKISEDVSSLRQTMNYKGSQDFFRKSNAESQAEKPHKFQDFLRQTMDPKSTKAIGQKNYYDSMSSKAIYNRGQETRESYRNYRQPQPHRIGQNKSAINLIENSSSLKEYQKLSEKIDRNKKMIDQLRKTANGDRNDYLKNVNSYTKSPTFINLEKEKQPEEITFKKFKDSNQYLTPKLDKGNYEARFNSSPLIEPKKNNQKKQTQPVISSLTSIASIKKKRDPSPIANKTDFKVQSIGELQIGKKLGEGKFGCVFLAIHKKTGGLFALKKIPKTLIKANFMIEQLALQIRLQSCMHHRNILAMYGFFDDKTHFYIVLEYMEGGTLYQKLKKGKVLSEGEAAKIIKQMTEAIEYMHDMGIAHRDIKPENIVISNNVFKLCDFGWAAMCNQRRKTYCGTFDYVAPQILEGIQYDMSVDLWCLGVMSFQLMTGKAPFYNISRKETMKKILNVQNQAIVYPETMSNDAKDFIDKLIRKNPNERIKACEALKHNFLKNVTDD